MRIVNVFIIVLISIVLSVVATIAVMNVNRTNVPQAKALLNKATKGAVTIVQEFPATNNLLGFVVKGKDKAAQLAIIYVDQQGHYLFSGTLIDAKGTNLTQKQFFTYIQPKSALEAYQALNSVTWVQQGGDAAPHKMYVFMDPNCIACHVFYEQLLPKINAGTLSVRWILVSFLKPSSLAKTEAILAAKDPVAALAQNEKNFNVKTEEGGIQPLKNISPEIKAKAKSNMDFLVKHKILVTPTLLYKNKQGFVTLHAGGLTGAELDAMLNELSDQF